MKKFLAIVVLFVAACGGHNPDINSGGSVDNNGLPHNGTVNQNGGHSNHGGCTVTPTSPVSPDAGVVLVVDSGVVTTPDAGVVPVDSGVVVTPDATIIVPDASVVLPPDAGAGSGSSTDGSVPPSQDCSNYQGGTTVSEINPLCGGMCEEFCSMVVASGCSQIGKDTCINNCHVFVVNHNVPTKICMLNTVILNIWDHIQKHHFFCIKNPNQYVAVCH